MVKELGKKLIAQNKSARHDYFIEEVFECGIVLSGTEVKSLRAGRASLIDGYATVENGELVGRTVMNEPNSFLSTEKQYGDFILELDFKVIS